jgi:FMN phosphatase YigB (HAD superfamily)
VCRPKRRTRTRPKLHPATDSMRCNAGADALETVTFMSTFPAAGVMRIRAITLDLDDTLWPIEPVMLRAEQRLDAWLREHCPPVADAYPIPAMRALRDQVAAANPDLAHDFTSQRLLCLRSALTPLGYGETHVEQAFAEFYGDALPALERLAARFPLVSLSNGNADLERIGIARFFRFSISSRKFGKAKPAAEIFHAACAGLDLRPDEVLHVGDDPLTDVIGASQAGLRSAWLNRKGEAWTHAVSPDLTIRDLDELARALEAVASAA